MGQKGNPRGFRLVIKKDWDSMWYANKADFGMYLNEDRAIRSFLASRPACKDVSKFTIQRMSGKVQVTVHTPRPGTIIGKGGSEIEALKAALHHKLGLWRRDNAIKGATPDVFIEVEEIKRPDLDAKCVADNIARQLEGRISFRRAMKQTLKKCMDAGALGIKVQIGGRVGGAEIARTEGYQEGRLPRHTLRADIQYALSEALTTYGKLGVKVWINRGEESQQTAAGGA